MWQSVLAVVAHPDDESFGLGALMHGLAARGLRTGVLCLTHGEASTLQGVDGELRVVREAELRAAAAILDVGWVRLADHPDGGLVGVPVGRLDDEVRDAVDAFDPDALLTFDTTGITGHGDHVAATEAALRIAVARDLPVIAWTVPLHVARVLNQEMGTAFVGRAPGDVDLVVTISRTAQLDAVRAHPSQAVPGSVVWRRLELLGEHEHLRWLNRTRLVDPRGTRNIPWPR